LAKRGDPGSLSCMSKLVRYLDEDVEPFRVDDCNRSAHGPLLGRTDFGTVVRYCSSDGNIVARENSPVSVN